MQTRTLIAQEIVQVLQSAGLLSAFHMQNSKQAFASHTTDSRKVTQDVLFIAYQGVSFDAHTAVSELQKKYQGLGFIVERAEHFQTMRAANAFVCQVSDSREAWAWLAAHLNGNPHDKLRMIGITGTNGKTSTVWFIRQLLRTINEACLILGTLGVYCGEEKFPATHTTPDPDELFRQLALAVEKGVTWAAMEVSSHAVVQRRIGPLRFAAAAFTSFSRDHLDFHPTMEDYFQAKWQLFARLLQPEAVVWIADCVESWLPDTAFTSGFHFYGPERQGRTLQSGDAKFQVSSMSLETTELTIQKAGQTWKGQLPFGADFAIANFTAALLLLDGLLPGRMMAAQWSAIAPVPGRFEPVAAAFSYGLSIIVDYAHTPDALEKTLAKLRELTKGRLWVVFGCGGDRDRGKRPLMGAVAEQVADVIIVTSDNPRSEDPKAILDEISKGITKSNYQKIIDREAAILYAIQQASPGDSILIAGKGHEDYQIIGQQKLDFDDRLVAARLLQNRQKP